MEGHLAEWLVAGWFFLGMVAVETALALAVIYAWGQRTAQAVVMTGGITVAVWLMSRTVGLPVGPADFRATESVGAPDVASCLLELGAAALVWRTAAASGPSVADPITSTVRPADRWMTMALITAALTITAVGLRPALGADESHVAPVHRSSTSGSRAGTTNLRLAPPRGSSLSAMVPPRSTTPRAGRRGA